MEDVFKIVSDCHEYSWKSCLEKLLEHFSEDKKSLISHDYEVVRNGETYAIFTPVSNFTLCHSYKDLNKDGQYSVENYEDRFESFEDLKDFLSSFADDFNVDENLNAVNNLACFRTIENLSVYNDSLKVHEKLDPIALINNGEQYLVNLEKLISEKALKNENFCERQVKDELNKVNGFSLSR